MQAEDETSEKTVKLQKNVPQCKNMKKTLNIPSSTVHNIIKNICGTWLKINNQTDMIDSVMKIPEL